MKTIAYLLLILGAVYGAMAKERGERLIVTVGVSAQEPLVVIGPDGKTVDGMAVQVLNHVAGLNGWQIRYVPDTLVNNLKRVEQGELDLAMPVPWPNRLFGRVDLPGKGFLPRGVVFM